MPVCSILPSAFASSICECVLVGSPYLSPFYLLPLLLTFYAARAGIGTKIMATTDPDGYKIVFVDNEDFLKELELAGK